MIKLWTIAANTFIETIRQPIYLVLLLATIGALLIAAPLTGYSMETDYETGDARLLVDFGLSTLMTSSLFIAAFSASAALAKEIERKTVLTVVSKPVPRTIVLGGKFAGVFAAVTTAYYIASLVFLLTVRHGVMSRATMPYDMPVIAFGVGGFALAALVALFCNYFFGWNFSGSFVTMNLLFLTLALGLVLFIGSDWKPIPIGEGLDPQMLVVMLLVWMAVAIMTALAVAISARLGQISTIGLCAGIFLLSLVSDAWFEPFAEANVLARVAYWIAPNLAYFYQLDALNKLQPISAQYVGFAAGYAVLYSAGALLLGMALLQTREMDVQQQTSSAPGTVNLYAWLLRLRAFVAAIVGLALLTGSPQWSTIQVGSSLIVAAILLWLWAGYFGRGKRWALYLVLFLVPVQLIVSVVYLVFVNPELLDSVDRLLVVALAALEAAYVLFMMLLRATRAHFALRRRSSTSPAQAPTAV